MKVKIDLPSVEVSKYLILLEKISETFKNIEQQDKNKVQYTRLRVDKDSNLYVANVNQKKLKKKKVEIAEVGKIKNFNSNKKANKAEIKTSSLDNFDKIDLDSFIGLKKKPEKKEKKEKKGKKAEVVEVATTPEIEVKAIASEVKVDH